MRHLTTRSLNLVSTSCPCCCSWSGGQRNRTIRARKEYVLQQSRFFPLYMLYDRHAPCKQLVSGVINAHGCFSGSLLMACPPRHLDGCISSKCLVWVFVASIMDGGYTQSWHWEHMCSHLLQLSRILSMSTFRALSSCVPSVKAGTWSSSNFISSTAAHSRNCIKMTDERQEDPTCNAGTRQWQSMSALYASTPLA